MTEERKNSGKHNLSTEDLLNDYLKDIFGSDGLCTSNAEVSEHNIDEDFIELKEAESFTNRLKSHNNLDGSSCYKNSDSDEPIVVSEYDLLPQERKGAVEKFCVNKVNLFRSPKNQVLFSDSQFNLGKNRVEEGSFLIPIIDFSKVSSKQGFRSQEEAHLLLLNSLYFLRRPLPAKVRENFLNFGEQAIDDFHAAKWLAQFKNEALEEE